MIRGAFILAAGFSLGYGKALSECDDIREYLQKIIDSLTEVTADSTPTEKDVEVIDIDPTTENKEPGETL